MSLEPDHRTPQVDKRRTVDFDELDSTYEAPGAQEDRDVRSNESR